MDFINPITWIDASVKYLGSLIKTAFMASALNIYNISFFVLIIICMYCVIQAMCGSNKGKIGIVSSITVFAIIEMVKTLILGF